MRRGVRFLLLLAIAAAALSAGSAQADTQQGTVTLGGVTSYYWVTFNQGPCLGGWGYQITGDESRFHRTATFWDTPDAYRVLGVSGTSCSSGTSYSSNANQAHYISCYGCRGSTWDWTASVLGGGFGWPYIKAAGANLIGGCVTGRITNTGSFYGDLPNRVALYGTIGCISP